MSVCKFGIELRENDFLLVKDHTHINQGSFGAVPKVVQEQRISYINQIESNPDRWKRWIIPDLYKESLSAAASFIKSDLKNLVFVNNATTASNSVLKSVPLSPGDAIMINSYTYAAVRNTALSAAKRCDAEVLELPIPLEINSAAELVELFRKYIEEHSNIKLIVLDYISSATAVLYPVKEIIQLCKQHEVLVLLDGAHTPGQLQLNLEQLGDIGVDFYVGNFHKWVFSPRGCAVLWCHPKHHDVIQPLVTSHNYNTGRIQEDFYTQGTIDNTPFVCVKRAVDFYESLGGLDEVSKYCSDLVDKAAQMLCEAWGTDMLPVSKDLMAPFMRVVGLPDNPNYPIQSAQVVSRILPMMKDLNFQYKITTLPQCIHGKPWVRISAFVYNTIEDYERLRDVILQMKEDSQK